MSEVIDNLRRRNENLRVRNLVTRCMAKAHCEGLCEPLDSV